MKKVYNGREYEIGEIESISECTCAAEILIDRDGSVSVALSGNECWCGQLITINGVMLAYIAYDGFDFPGDGTGWRDILPDSDPNWHCDDLRDLLGYDLYEMLTSDDTRVLAEHHGKLCADALVDYIKANHLRVYMDDLRGFSNEWALWLVDDPSDIPDDWHELDPQEAAHLYYEVAPAYEYNCTTLRMYRDAE